MRGQGRYSMELSHYDPVPGNLQQQIADAHKKEYAAAGQIGAAPIKARRERGAIVRAVVPAAKSPGRAGGRDARSRVLRPSGLRPALALGVLLDALTP